MNEVAEEVGQDQLKFCPKSTQISLRWRTSSRHPIVNIFQHHPDDHSGAIREQPSSEWVGGWVLLCMSTH